MAGIWTVVHGTYGLNLRKHGKGSKKGAREAEKLDLLLLSMFDFFCTMAV